MYMMLDLNSLFQGEPRACSACERAGGKDCDKMPMIGLVLCLNHNHALHVTLEANCVKVSSTCFPHATSMGLGKWESGRPSESQKLP